jgi:RNA-directed DNA polymerase
MGKGGSVSVKEVTAMVEDTPVNTGVACWPDPVSAAVAVRRMQTKLHRWAGEDRSRRFGDLFNLVYDPAFLVHAWQRVSTKGSTRNNSVIGAVRSLNVRDFRRGAG